TVRGGSIFFYLRNPMAAFAAISLFSRRPWRLYFFSVCETRWQHSLPSHFSAAVLGGYIFFSLRNPTAASPARPHKTTFP
ncbi:MAG: hypothetical protein IJS09_00020, partial [Treponema sp.]|nr:hypothetical protein [Treponema sp.]